MDLGSLSGSLAASAFGSGAAPLATVRSGAWLPEAAGTGAAAVDRPLLVLILAGAAAVALVTGLALAWVLRYRRRDEAARGAPAGRPNPLLLGAWTLAAAALAGGAFVAGLGGFVDQAVAPYGAYDIAVTARQWSWSFTYPNGWTADTLHVPLGRPVRLTLASEDVVHGLSVPALRLSETILPGRTAEAWFEATLADTFTLRSDVYSGDGYSGMATALIAESQPAFQAWLDRVSDIFSGRTEIEVGELLYNRKGCVACHSLDGTKRVGPSFLDVYGHEVELRDGGSVVADDAYIRESILEPNVRIVAGYEPVMTPYAGQITDREIAAVTAWLKTLSGQGGDAAAAASDTAAAASDTTAAASDTTGTNGAGQKETE
ncbi:MAG: c-type cytochrome [Candidatus Krumholzibacteriia bacterium]